MGVPRCFFQGLAGTNSARGSQLDSQAREIDFAEQEDGDDESGS